MSYELRGLCVVGSQLESISVVDCSGRRVSTNWGVGSAMYVSSNAGWGSLGLSSQPVFLLLKFLFAMVKLE